MDLRAYILSQLLLNVSAGQTTYSLERMAECGSDPLTAVCELKPVCDRRSDLVCKAPWYAPSMGAWVRYESEQHATERYKKAVDVAITTARRLLCEGESEGCEPMHWGYNRQTKKNTGTVESLVVLSFAVAVPESGLREDVLTGRGRFKRDRSGAVDGGEGRGPGNEAGYWQAHPLIAWRFMGLESRPDRKGDYLSVLVGEDDKSLERAAEVAMRMLAHSREWCALPSRTEKAQVYRYQWAWAALSYYGTGNSCYAWNEGKTAVRYRLFEKFMSGKHS